VQQQIKELSLSYAEVARTVVSDSLQAIGDNLNAEKLGQMLEEARQSVTQLIRHTRKQLALEQGRDEVEDEGVEDYRSSHSTEQPEEQKSSSSK